MDYFTDPYDTGWGDHSNFEWTNPYQQYQGPPPQVYHQALQELNENYAYWPPNQSEFPPCFQPQELGQYQSIHPPMPPKCLEEMMGDLITSQQLMQRDLMASYNVAHEMQDTHLEQMISLDHLARQMTQLATSINDMCGNGGGIPAQVQPPRKETLSQITLRSGKELKASFNNYSNNGPGETSEQGARLPSAAHCPSQETAQFEWVEDSDEEIEVNIIIPPEGPTPIPLRPEAAIMKWCNKVEHAKSPSNLPNPDELPSQSNLPSLRAEAKLVPLEVQPPKLELKPPDNLKYVYLEKGQEKKLINVLKGFNFLEAEFLQDMNHSPFIEEQVELEELSKCKLVHTQGLSDEEIEIEIMTWCKRKNHTNPPERCKLPSSRVEEELLPLEIYSPKLEPNEFSSKLKYLEENETILMIINSSVDKSQEEELIKVLKRHKELIGWTLANDIMSISLDVCMFYMSSKKGSKLYRDPKRKLNASTWKDWKARFDDAFSEEHMYVAQFVELGSLDATMGKVAEGASKPTHEPEIKIQGGSCTISTTSCQTSPYPPLCAGEVISIQLSLSFVAYMCFVCDVCVTLKFCNCGLVGLVLYICCGLAGLCDCLVLLVISH